MIQRDLILLYCKKSTSLRHQWEKYNYREVLQWKHWYRLISLLCSKTQLRKLYGSEHSETSKWNDQADAIFLQNTRVRKLLACEFRLCYVLLCGWSLELKIQFQIHAKIRKGRIVTPDCIQCAWAIYIPKFANEISIIYLDYKVGPIIFFSVRYISLKTQDDNSNVAFLSSTLGSSTIQIKVKHYHSVTCN
jgi:hypothetical protein